MWHTYVSPFSINNTPTSAAELLASEIVALNTRSCSSSSTSSSSSSSSSSSISSSSVNPINRRVSSVQYHGVTQQLPLNLPMPMTDAYGYNRHSMTSSTAASNTVPPINNTCSNNNDSPFLYSAFAPTFDFNLHALARPSSPHQISSSAISQARMQEASHHHFTRHFPHYQQQQQPQQQQQQQHHYHHQPYEVNNAHHYGAYQQTQFHVDDCNTQRGRSFSSIPQLLVPPFGDKMNYHHQVFANNINKNDDKDSMMLEENFDENDDELAQWERYALRLVDEEIEEDNHKYEHSNSSRDKIDEVTQTCDELSSPPILHRETLNRHTLVNDGNNGRYEFPPSKRFVNDDIYSSDFDDDDEISLHDSLLLPLPRLSQMDIADQISPDMITFGDIIGEGSFGEVFRGEYTGQAVAIKRLKLRSILKPNYQASALRKFENEVSILKSLRHPNIVNYLGLVPFPTEEENSAPRCQGNESLTHSDDSSEEYVLKHHSPRTSMMSSSLSKPALYCIVTELCPNGTLLDFLRRRHRLSWSCYLGIAKDIVSGLQFLHAKKIIHRDLKPHNVLMTESNKAKLADFGLAHVKKSDSASSRPYGVCGTKCFVAPEVLRNEPYGVSADIFSLGVVLCQMITGAHPLHLLSSSEQGNNGAGIAQSKSLSSSKSSMSYEARIVAGHRPVIPDYALPDLKQLIEACWATDPDKRPYITHVMKWLDSISRNLNVRLQSAIDDIPPDSRQYFEEMQARITDLTTELDTTKENLRTSNSRLEQSEKLRKVQLVCAQLKYQRLQENNNDLHNNIKQLLQRPTFLHDSSASDTDSMRLSSVDDMEQHMRTPNHTNRSRRMQSMSAISLRTGGSGGGVGLSSSLM